MKVIYLQEIELKLWKPFRVLAFERDSDFIPKGRDSTIQVTTTRTASPRSCLYNLLADEHLVRLWPVNAETEEKGIELLKEYTREGWIEVACFISGAWLYLERKWYVPESMNWPGPHGQGAMNALEETIRENAETPGEEVHRAPEGVGEAGERPEAQAG